MYLHDNYYTLWLLWKIRSSPCIMSLRTLWQPNITFNHILRGDQTTPKQNLKKIEGSLPEKKLDRIILALIFDPNLTTKCTFNRSSERPFHVLPEYCFSFTISYSYEELQPILYMKVRSTLLPCYMETIQVEHPNIVVVSFLQVYNVCTEFERNLRHASIFRVDLTRNDPSSKTSSLKKSCRSKRKGV